MQLEYDSVHKVPGVQVIEMSLSNGDQDPYSGRSDDWPCPLDVCGPLAPNGWSHPDHLLISMSVTPAIGEAGCPCSSQATVR